MCCPEPQLFPTARFTPYLEFYSYHPICWQIAWFSPAQVSKLELMQQGRWRKSQSADLDSSWVTWVQRASLLLCAFGLFLCFVSIHFLSPMKNICLLDLHAWPLSSTMSAWWQVRVSELEYEIRKVIARVRTTELLKQCPQSSGVLPPAGQL